VNWNGRHLLDACLGSLRLQDPAPDRIIVVDNGSTDGSLAHLRSTWPDVTVLDAGANLGFPAATNLGIQEALAGGAGYILLLNNDAQLLPGALPELASALDELGPAVWAAAPKIRYRSAPKTIWSAGGRFDWWRGLALDRGWGEPDLGQYDVSELVTFANACCLLVRARVFRDVGLLDDAYFMYFEDAELAARAGRDGARVAYRPAAGVLHDVQASSGGTPGAVSPAALYYWTRNRGRFISRNVRNPVRRFVAHAYVLASRVVRMAQAITAGRGHEARVIARGLTDGYVRRRTGPADPSRPPGTTPPL
jgi:GT2 family glycosyltransferase